MIDASQTLIPALKDSKVGDYIRVHPTMEIMLVKHVGPTYMRVQRTMGQYAACYIKDEFQLEIMQEEIEWDSLGLVKEPPYPGIDQDE